MYTLYYKWHNFFVVLVMNIFNWLILLLWNFMHSCIQVKHMQSQLLPHSARLLPEVIFKFDTQVLLGRNSTPLLNFV